MAFETFAEFIAMGKHGFYVWLVYGVTAVAIGSLVFACQRANRRALDDVDETEVE